jgi:hypothetical protein
LVIILTHIILQDIKKICETDISILRKSSCVSFLFYNKYFSLMMTF